MEAAAPTVLENEFWEHLDRLVTASRLVVDRPKGTHHPRYPDMVYPLNYGYLDGTTTVDGGGLDVWAGSLADKTLTALVLTVDLHKRDVEVKLLLGCTKAEQKLVLKFHKENRMGAILIHRKVI